MSELLFLMTKLKNNMYLRLFSVAFLTLFSISSYAEALDMWLDKMQHAMTMKNYEGTLIIRQKNQLQAMRVQHGVDENGMWESLESLSGEARKVIRKHGKVTTIFPNRGLLTIRHDANTSSVHPRLPENRDVLKQHYELQLAGKDRVAEKSAQILKVMPKDNYRYGFKFWLDQDSGLLLKCDLLDENGDVIEQLMFSELKVLNTAPELRVDMTQSGDYQVVDMDQGRQPQSASRWQAEKLPEGFSLTRSSTKPSAHGEGLMHHMVYSDGMASVSVFVEKRVPDDMALKGASNMGALNAFGQPKNGHHVTVIGEVPEATVRLIGQSVSFANR